MQQDCNTGRMNTRSVISRDFRVTNSWSRISVDWIVQYSLMHPGTTVALSLQVYLKEFSLWKIVVTALYTRSEYTKPTVTYGSVDLTLAGIRLHEKRW